MWFGSRGAALCMEGPGGREERNVAMFGFQV
jgi:hypothetical protein